MIVKRVILLGASGFIGRQCITALLRAEGVVVEAVARCRPRWAEPDDDRLRWHEVDLFNPEAVAGLLGETCPSHAVHLAWHAGQGSIWTASENKDWIAASLAFARTFARFGGRRLVVSGSCAEYAGSGTRREADIAEPETPYGLAKRDTRLALTSFCKTAGVSMAWARLFHMYGPHENPRRLVSGAILALLKGDPFVCSDGGQIRDFLHSADVAEGLVSLLSSRIDGPINIGCGRAVSIRQILGMVGHSTGRGDLIHFGGRPRAVNDPDVLLPDLERQKSELGWLPNIPHEQRIAATVNWWRDELAIN